MWPIVCALCWTHWCCITRDHWNTRLCLRNKILRSVNAKKVKSKLSSQKWIKKPICDEFSLCCSLFHWIFRLNCTGQCNSCYAIGSKNPVKKRTNTKTQWNTVMNKSVDSTIFSAHRSQYFISNSVWLSHSVSSSSNAKVMNYFIYFTSLTS